MSEKTVKSSCGDSGCPCKDGGERRKVITLEQLKEELNKTTEQQEKRRKYGGAVLNDIWGKNLVVCKLADSSDGVVVVHRVVTLSALHNHLTLCGCHKCYMKIINQLRAKPPLLADPALLKCTCNICEKFWFKTANY